VGGRTEWVGRRIDGWIDAGVGSGRRRRLLD
jgi:hypothetical protein